MFDFRGWAQRFPFLIPIRNEEWAKRNALDSGFPIMGWAQRFPFGKTQMPARNEERANRVGLRVSHFLGWAERFPLRENADANLQ